MPFTCNADCYCNYFVYRQEDDCEVFEDLDKNSMEADSETSTPDSVFQSTPPAPLQYDVLPDVNTYTPMPIIPPAATPTTVAPLPYVNDSRLIPLAVVTSSVTPINSSDSMQPDTSHPSQISVPVTITTESIIAPILPTSFPIPTVPSILSDTGAAPKEAAVKQKLQVSELVIAQKL